MSGKQIRRGATWARKHRITACSTSGVEALEARVLLATGQISGVKWDDQNGDGVRDPGEPGVAGWTIYLDMNGNGQLDATEPMTTTDASGAYTFDALPAGTYFVAELSRPGWSQTFPSSGVHPLVADEHTVLLDHFDGSTSGVPFGSPTYSSSLSGLGSAVAVGPGKYVEYVVPGWYDGDSAIQGTVEMWVRPEVLGGLLDFNWNEASSYPPDGHILNVETTDSGAPYFGVFNFGPPETPRSVTGAATVQTGAWTHLALSWSSTASKIYINGQVVASLVGNVYPELLNPFYAYLNLWGTSGFSGLIDEFQISNIQRTDAEILHAALSGLRDHTVALTAGAVITGQDFGNQQQDMPPTVTKGSYEFNSSPQAVRIRFSKPVNSLILPGGLSVVNLATMNTAPVQPPIYDAATNTVSFPVSTLPDGNYRAILKAANVKDTSGNPLAADFSFDFFVFAGDANHDRSVNFADLVAVAQNYGAISGTTFSKGDFNYDGKVDFADLVTVAQKYGTTLAAPVAAAPVAAPVMALPPEKPTFARSAPRSRPIKSLFSMVPIVNSTTSKPKLPMHPRHR